MSALLKPKYDAPTIYTWAAYEREEAVTEVKLEFVNGQVHAMAGGTDNHNRIADNTFNEIR